MHALGDAVAGGHASILSLVTIADKVWSRQVKPGPVNASTEHRCSRI